MTNIIYILLSLSFVFVGCESSDKFTGVANNTVSKIYVEDLFHQTKVKSEELESDIEKRFELLINRIAFLEDKIESLQSKLEDKIGDLDYKIFETKEEVKPSSAVFNLKEKGGYHVVGDSAGSFFISVKEVVPYLDCYKVTFAIGNPYAVDFVNPTIKLEWRMSYEKYKEKCERKGEKPSAVDWLISKKEKEYSINKTLEAGKWNNIELILNANVDELDCVSFSFGSIKTVLMNVGK